MHKRASFWKPFGSEPVNYSQKLLKSAEKYFDPPFSSFWAKFSSKKLFSITPDSLGLLNETLTGNYEYSRRNSENLPLLIQIKLSKNPSLLSIIMIKFFISKWNFECSEKKKKKNELHWSTVSEVIDSEKCAYLTASQSLVLKNLWQWTC